MCLFAGGVLIGSVSAQTVKEKIEKAHKDPWAKENAGKADVHATDKKKIYDSTSVKTSAADKSTNKIVTKKKKSKKKKR